MAYRQAKSKNVCSKDKQGSQIRPKTWPVSDKHYVVGDCRFQLKRRPSHVYSGGRTLNLGHQAASWCAAQALEPVLSITTRPAESPSPQSG